MTLLKKPLWATHDGTGMLVARKDTTVMERVTFTRRATWPSVSRKHIQGWSGGRTWAVGNGGKQDGPKGGVGLQCSLVHG